MKRFFQESDPDNNRQRDNRRTVDRGVFGNQETAADALNFLQSFFWNAESLIFSVLLLEIMSIYPLFWSFFLPLSPPFISTTISPVFNDCFSDISSRHSFLLSSLCNHPNIHVLSSIHPPFKTTSHSLSCPLLITPSPVLPLVARETAVYSVAVHLLTLSFYYLRVRFLIRRTKGVKAKSDAPWIWLFINESTSWNEPRPFLKLF